MFLCGEIFCGQVELFVIQHFYVVVVSKQLDNFGLLRAFGGKNLFEQHHFNYSFTVCAQATTLLRSVTINSPFIADTDFS